MTEVFDKLNENNISPNTYFILHCLNEKVIPNKDCEVNQSLELKRLQNNEWVTSKYELTDKSKVLLEEINSLFKRSKKKTSKDLMGENFMKNIENYLDIFPKFKLPSGKYARSNKKNLENNFRWFFENHDYDWTVVMKATKKYVNQFELSGFKYMRTSQYFIRKQNTDKTYDSELATYCDVIINGDQEFDNSNHFKEKIV